jgi:hypothetical protein
MTFLLERERVHQNAAAPYLIEVLGQSAIRVTPECTPVDFAIVAGVLQHMYEPIVLEAQCRGQSRRECAQAAFQRQDYLIFATFAEMFDEVTPCSSAPIKASITGPSSRVRLTICRRTGVFD